MNWKYCVDNEGFGAVLSFFSLRLYLKEDIG